MTELHTALDECVASFVKKPAALVFGMGCDKLCSSSGLDGEGW